MCGVQDVIIQYKTHVEVWPNNSTWPVHLRILSFIIIIISFLLCTYLMCYKSGEKYKTSVCLHFILVVCKCTFSRHRNMHIAIPINDKLIIAAFHSEEVLALWLICSPRLMLLTSWLFLLKHVKVIDVANGCKQRLFCFSEIIGNNVHSKIEPMGYFVLISFKIISKPY